jgi:hypothetical protein
VNFFPLKTQGEVSVGKLENMIDNINKYLKTKGLPKLDSPIKDIYALFEGSLRSVWTLEDREQRETLAVDIAQALKPYFGGKKIEDALDEIKGKLEREQKQKDEKKKTVEEHNEIRNLKDKLKDPDYVPTFEELLKAKGEGKSKKSQ